MVGGGEEEGSVCVLNIIKAILKRFFLYRNSYIGSLLWEVLYWKSYIGILILELLYSNSYKRSSYSGVLI